MKPILITLALFLFSFCLEAQKVRANDTTIYRTVEQEPEFPGGEAAFNKFLTKNLRYPAAAKTCNGGNIITKIIIRFVVEKDGSLSNVKCEKPSCPEFDAETRRIMQSSPKWIPGKNHKKLVRVSYVIPIGIEPQFEDQ